MTARLRRERERREHREHILRAAERLFAERGFHKATMLEIARRAEFALGTIYRFFGGKQQIYEELIERKLHELVETVSEQMALEGSPLGRIRRFVEAKLGFFARNLDFAQVYMAEAHGWYTSGTRPVARRLRERYEGLIKKLEASFEDGIGQGLIARCDPRILAAGLDGLTSALVLQWTRGMGSGSPRREIEAVNRWLQQGILLRPESA